MTFTPIELTDEYVKKIYDQCTIDEGADSAVFITLYQRYNPDSIAYFSFDALEEHKKEIAYIYGQIKNIHLCEEKISLPNLAIKYDEKGWIKNKETLIKFLYLGIGVRLISKIDKEGMVQSLGINPTLSPGDPNFESWWAEHKSEWED